MGFEPVEELVEIFGVLLPVGCVLRRKQLAQQDHASLSQGFVIRLLFPRNTSILYNDNRTYPQHTGNNWYHC